MSRTVNCAAAVLLVTLSGIASAGSVHAQPPPPPGPCSFTLSPPQVVQVGGVDMVSATVTPAGCAAPWRPRLAVACLHMGEQGRCAQASDSNPAQVYFEPYSPGATYVATGRGCGRVFDFTIDPTCQLLGPFNATL